MSGSLIVNLILLGPCGLKVISFLLATKSEVEKERKLMIKREM